MRVEARISLRRALVVSVALSFSACTHVLHPAHVQPGWQVELGGGAVLPEYRAGLGDVPPGAVPSRYDPSGHDVQLAVGYGKRYSDDVAVLVQLIAPLTRFNPPYEFDSQGTSLPAVDLYLQLAGGGIDAGVGAVAGLALLSLYAELGKRGRTGPVEWSADVGVSGLPDSIVTPFSLVTGRYGRWTVGMWSDVVLYGGGRFHGCEDCTEPDWLQRRLSFGALIRWTPGASPGVRSGR